MANMNVRKMYEFNPETDLIGQGGFGSVYKARDVHLDMVVAIKKYSGNLPQKYSLFEEIKRVIQLNHPNLVRYYDAFELDEKTHFGDTIQVGIMEYVNGGDLLAFLQKKPDYATLKHVFRGIMEGLHFLHSKDIIHRDMKPENILIQEEDGQFTPKIADFGISKVLSGGNSGASSLVIGSVEYMAPEQFNPRRYGVNGELHTNLDLWSLGTLIYEAFLGTAPFGKTKQGVSRDEIMRNILEKEVTDLDKIPAPFNEIVRRCLVRHAEKRAQSTGELLALLGNEGIYTSTSSATSVVQGGNPTGVLNPADIPIHLPNREPIVKRRDTKDNPVAGVGKQKPIEDVGFKWFHLLPLFTALLGYTFFDSKYSIFGWDKALGQIIIYPMIATSVLILVNIFSKLVRKVRSFEASSFLVSYLVLGYLMAKSLIIFYYENIGVQGLVYDINQQPFSKIYPLVAIAGITLFVVARFRKMQWFEMIGIFMGYAFFLFTLINILLPNTAMWFGATVFIGLLCAFAGYKMKK